jgi:uncharacterized protein YjaG (DUF416 family)
MVGEENISASLTELPRKKQLAFALLVFERLLPSLIAFSKDTGFDDSCFLQARAAAWDALQSGTNRILDKSWAARLKRAPDTDAFTHQLTSHALNAALAVSDIIEFLLDGRIDHIAHVSTLARDSVYLYLTSLESSVVPSHDEDRRIATDPLMRQELRLEEEDIRFLSGLPDEFDNETLLILRTRASRQPFIIPLPRRD